MHIYFSGIGGAGIGPLAFIAHQAGFTVSGSDAKRNLTVQYLEAKGVPNIHIGQDYDQIAAVHAKNHIDWFVHTSALPIDQPDAPELKFCAEHHIRTSKRDEFLRYLLEQKDLKMIAVAGTHGKTTTTAMAVWLCKQLGMPISYSVGAKLSFGEMGEFDPASEYFVYEADEYSRNFLAFHPHISLISGVGWDHPDIYPTRAEYYEAFRVFLGQSNQKIIWQNDLANLGYEPDEHTTIVDKADPRLNDLTLPGLVNRQNALLVIEALHTLTGKSFAELTGHMNRFPGVSRRFEQLAPRLYTDYAHTPPKIRGALQLAHEVAGPQVVVVYEGLHNTRQHFIKDELKDLFEDVKQLYIVPSYLAREDPDLAILTPDDLKQLMNEKTRSRTTATALDDRLKDAIKHHLYDGDLVLCLTAGGGGSLDEWLRTAFTKR